MGDSNGDWGQLPDDESRAAWDAYAALPAPGENAPLDAFLKNKHLTMGDLVRTGARLNGSELVWAYRGGLKYRDIISGRRRNSFGAEFPEMKHVPRQSAPPESGPVAIVAEGETDGARLSALYPEADVFILPAGAADTRQENGFRDQLDGYALVLLAHDPDEAGERGAAMFAQGLPKSLRWLSPDGDDWAELQSSPPPIPEPESVEVPAGERLIVSARDLLELDVPDVASWLEGALLPIGGSMIVHGWTKSFKSFGVLDLGSSIAQGEPWALFEATNEPGSVVVMQYEIPWAFLRQRIEALRRAAVNLDGFLDGFHVWTPLSRPRFRAGDRTAEDAIRRELDRMHANVFILDPVRRSVGAADINSEADVRPLLDFFARLQDDGITVITVHHDRKTDRGSGDAAAMTGSGAFAGDFDSIVSLAIPKGLTERDPHRDMHFLLRNAPSPSTRSFEMSESGLIYYDRPYAAVGDPPPEADNAPDI